MGGIVLVLGIGAVLCILVVVSAVSGEDDE